MKNECLSWASCAIKWGVIETDRSLRQPVAKARCCKADCGRADCCKADCGRADCCQATCCYGALLLGRLLPGRLLPGGLVDGSAVLVPDRKPIDRFITVIPLAARRREMHTETELST